MQTVNIELKKGEKVFSESGNMAWMSENIRMETSTRGGLFAGIKRRLAGESIFLNTFTCTEGIGIVTFSSEFPGKILPIKLSKKALICQKDAFMCAEDSVKLDMFFRKKLGAGFFGGEGLFLSTLKGPGKIWLQSMPFSNFAARIGQYLLTRKEAGGVRRGIGGIIEGLGRGI